MDQRCRKGQEEPSCDRLRHCRRSLVRWHDQLRLPLLPQLLPQPLPVLLPPTMPGYDKDDCACQQGLLLHGDSKRLPSQKRQRLRSLSSDPLPERTACGCGQWQLSCPTVQHPGSHFTIYFQGIIFACFESRMSTNNSGQIILRILGEFCIAWLGQTTKIIS